MEANVKLLEALILLRDANRIIAENQSYNFDETETGKIVQEAIDSAIPKTEHKEFKIVAVSSNTNSFGLYGVVIVARDGMAFEIATSELNKPEKNAVLIGEVEKGSLLSLGNIFYEIPSRKEDAPAKVLAEIWK